MNNSKKSKSKMKSKTRQELDDDFSAALARADAAQAKADKARAEVDRALAEAARALNAAIRKGEALQRHIRAEKASADACASDANLDGHNCPIYSGTREVLVKALGMLGSDHVGERAAAALMAEKQRVRLGKTWNQLIVREDDDDEDFNDDLEDDEGDLDDYDDDEDLDDDDEDAS